MIRSTLILLAAMAAGAQAGTVAMAPSAPVSMAPSYAASNFGPGWVVSGHAIFLTPDGEYDDVWGGGVGVDYYFSEFFGLGASASWAEVDAEDTGTGDSEVGGVYTIDATFRYPLGNYVAPYVLVGGGVEDFADETEILGRAGVGLQVQFSPAFGIFGDWLYHFPGGGGGDDDFEDFQTVRVGIRVGF
jgi:hypothetical protein